MKLVYSAQDITEAHIVAGMLEAQGLGTHVGGHYLQGGVGELASFDFARVYVEDEDVPAAMAAIREYEGEPAAPVTAGDQQSPPLPPGLITVLVFLAVFAITYLVMT
ncbi:MAG: DUF2007 domain-containing protein [Gammaproteobacteria bacterium]|nr:DUF2007 domain-containing protein [Gammaproteobacteria bacterium]